MRDSWSDEAAQVELDRHGSEWPRELVLLAYASRLLGSEPELACAGGGNVSYKGSFARAGLRPRPALFVKHSGADLGRLEPSDLVVLDLDHLRGLLELPALSDQEMLDELACHRLAPHPARASIETLLHAALPAPCVIHTHPAAVLALTNRTDAASVLDRALGPELPCLPYVRPGLELARAVRSALGRAGPARAMVLLHHGLLTWGETAKEAYQSTLRIVSQAEAELARGQVRQIAVPGSSFPANQTRYPEVAPVVRGVLGPEHADQIEARVILAPLLDRETADLADSPVGKNIVVSPPLTPDHLIRVRRLPLWIDHPRLEDPVELRQQLRQALEAYCSEYRSYLAAHCGQQLVEYDPRALTPKVVALPGLGVVCAGKSAEEASLVRELTRQALRVKASIYQGGGEYLPLAPEHLFDMEFRGYQRAKLEDRQEPSLGSTVVLVTGAAGAIGSGICEVLGRAGCHVAATDLPGAALDQLGAELGPELGCRWLGLPLDVTDPESVERAFAEVIRAWGGIDAVVINAGLAHVAELVDLRLHDFRRLERVNVEGALNLLQAAGRHFMRQASGGDVVIISTKNVFAPGASFGAYSATKAACHQLGRIASLEFARLGVRVNMVAPDAVFSHRSRRSGLWEQVGPSRMRARGLDPAGLEEYYRSRNLLKVRVTAEHVARAVLFFLSRQTPTTGATLPVDGGLPDAVPR